MKRHQVNHQSDRRVSCPICGKIFTRKDYLNRHVKNVHERKLNLPPPGEGKTKRSAEAVKNTNGRENGHEETGTQSKRRKEDREEDDEGRKMRSVSTGGREAVGTKEACERQAKRRRKESEGGSGSSIGSGGGGGHDDELDYILVEDPDEMPVNNHDSDESDDGEVDAEEDDDGGFLRMMRDNWNSIRSHHRDGHKVQDTYNFRVGSGIQVGEGAQHGHGVRSLPERRIRAIFNRQTKRFKINLSHGFILRNVETGELRYFHASQNNARHFDSPFLIANEHDLERFISAVEEIDVKEYAARQRPNTKWVVEGVTNVTFYVNKLDFPIGAGIFLPQYVKKNRAIRSLSSDLDTGKPYKDKLCIFRCIALHRGCSPNHLERDTKYYYEKYRSAVPHSHFSGIYLEDLHILEKLFEMNIQVFSLVEHVNDDNADDDDDDNDDDALRKDNGDVDTTNRRQASRSKVTAELVRRSHTRHRETMNINLFGDHFSFITDLQVYSKAYRCTKCDKHFTLLYRLKRHQVGCDGNVTHVFPGGMYRPTPTIFDRLKSEDIDVPDDMKFYPYRATFDFECYFESSDRRTPSGKFKVEARHIPLSASVASNVDGYESPKTFITDGNSQQLVDDMVQYLQEISRAGFELLNSSYTPVFEAIDTKIAEVKSLTDTLGEKGVKKRINQLNRLREKVEQHISVLPVLGFNSGKYDINLIRQFLYRALWRTETISFVIKKGNSYQCIQTESLKFLDILNYLAPGYSYRQFVAAYGTEMAKGFFPYEWMTDLQKLQVTQLPPHSAFYSKLTNSNITDEEYQYCQQVWTEQGMTSMRDFLCWYNELDVLPFLKAVENMFNFYQNLDVDMFKDAISVPGLTLRYLFKSLDSDVAFSLFKDLDKDLYYKMRKNIVGGPSIVFHRYHEKQKTMIRNGTKQCQQIIGYDANALYLWALMQPMPTGTYIRRISADGFKPVRQYRYGEMAVQWLDYVAHTDSISIQHMLNGVEKRIGHRRIPVDGYCDTTKTVYQFHGCYFHGHQCHLTHNKEYNDKRKCSMEELRKETAATSAYIRKEGFRLVEMYECAWRKQMASNPQVKAFVADRQMPREQRRDMTEQDILSSIRNDQMYGVVECDIHVPDHLIEHFAEMPPIFKNAEVGREDIGEHMRSYADEIGSLKQPRRTLIGSMKGDKIMIASPLLKWYLEHGLKVTKIYEVIQYTGRACFNNFGESVVHARRMGDKDPEKAVVAETMKLIGNSAYGKTITDKEKFRTVTACLEEEAPVKANSQYFRQLNLVGNSFCEVEEAKRSIRMDLPIQIGFFVYAFAKLRMLQFYYDFMDRYVERADFQYVCMDTDSAYIAFSGSTLETLIKPALREEFQATKHHWFPRTDTPEHRLHDKRTPGLFKEEWSGEGTVALCSKTYFCFGSDKTKYSCKGLNKRQKVPLTAKRYLDVLKTAKPGVGTNRGFRLHGVDMVTYTQVKEALPYLYIKRKVAADGVTTSPLSL